MKKFGSIALMVVLGLTTMAFIASAQTAPPGLQPPGNPGGLVDLSYQFGGRGGLSGMISAIINIILAVAGAISVMFLIIGGFQYILSGANEDLAKRGKTTLKNSIIGLIIIVLSYTVVSVVYNTLTNVRV
jgi:hypothetical protein